MCVCLALFLLHDLVECGWVIFDCNVVFVCVLFSRSRALSFSFLVNNVKITTNDDDKMRYVDESRFYFFHLFYFTPFFTSF